MEGADDGLLLPVTLNSGLKDRVAVLRILERDALYGAVDCLPQPLLLFYEMGIIWFT